MNDWLRELFINESKAALDAKAPILKSPNGTRWSIAVSDSGTLSASRVPTSPTGESGTHFVLDGTLYPMPTYPNGEPMTRFVVLGGHHKIIPADEYGISAITLNDSGSISIESDKYAPGDMFSLYEYLEDWSGENGGKKSWQESGIREVPVSQEAGFGLYVYGIDPSVIKDPADTCVYQLVTVTPSICPDCNGSGSICMMCGSPRGEDGICSNPDCNNDLGMYDMCYPCSGTGVVVPSA